MSNDLIDADVFRANVGIILAYADAKLLFGARVGVELWQFPQGGLPVGLES